MSEPPAETQHDVTALLLAWRAGEQEALGELMPLVYRQLMLIAGSLLRREWSLPAFETTALVHEAYLRLVDLNRISWESRTHFFAMSARIMRRVLVDQARGQRRRKRGGNELRLETSELCRVPDQPPPDIVAVDEAMRELSRHDPQLAEIVELRFFGGLHRTEIAEVMAISSATVTRRWYLARAWLVQYLDEMAS